MNACGGVGAGFPTVVVDESERRDDAAKNVFCAGIAHDDVTVRRVGDDDTDGSRFEDGLEACFAAAQSFFGLIAVVDIFEGAVPSDDFAVLVPSRGSAGPHPAPFTIAAADAVLNVKDLAGAQSFFPGSKRGLTVVGMNSTDPALSA